MGVVDGALASWPGCVLSSARLCWGILVGEKVLFPYHHFLIEREMVSDFMCVLVCWDINDFLFLPPFPNRSFSGPCGEAGGMWK